MGETGKAGITGAMARITISKPGAGSCLRRGSPNRGCPTYRLENSRTCLGTNARPAERLRDLRMVSLRSKLRCAHSMPHAGPERRGYPTEAQAPAHSEAECANDTTSHRHRP